MKTHQLSLTKKLLSIVLIVSSIVTCIVTSITLTYDYLSDLKRTNNTLIQIEDSYSKTLSTAVWNLDEQTITTQIEGILTIPDIVGILINIENSQIISRGDLTEDLALTHEFKLQINSKIVQDLGVVKLFASKSNIKSRVYNKALIVFFTQFLKTILVSFLLLVLIQKLFVSDIVKIKNHLNNINFDSILGHLQFSRNRFHDGYEDEIDVLVNSINKMQDRINEKKLELDTINHNLEDKVLERSQALIKQNKQLEVTSRLSAMGNMIRLIAEEFNNPLAIISARLQIIRKRDNLDELSQKNIDAIFNQIEKLNILINEMNYVNQDTSSENLTAIYVKDFLNNIIHFIEQMSNSQDIKFKINNYSDSLMIYCKPVQSTQVMLNLLSNSVEAYQEQDSKELSLNIIEQNKTVAIEVVDNGIGIKESDRANIFDPFFTTKNKDKSLGLGLPVAYNYMKNQGGSLELTNLSKPTVFTVIFQKSLNEKLK